MRGCASRTDGWLFCSLQKDYMEMVKNVVRGWQARKIMVHYCVIFFPLAVERGDEVRGLQEFHFVANTQEGERHLTIVCPDQTVIDLGEVLRFGFDRFADDDKRARLSIDGSKDSICLSMRSGAAWNGRSTKKDFIEIGKAAMAIEEALAQER